MSQTLGTRDVERFLSEFHDIAPEHQSAYAGRLKHIARQGFPSGVAAGRGKPAEYDADHLFQLVTVMELAQFGVMPGRAIALVSEAWPRLRGAVAEIWMVVNAGSHGTVVERPSIFWRVPVEALRHLARPDRPYSPDAADRLEVMTAVEANAALEQRGYNITRHAFIVADQVIHDALTQLGYQLGSHDALATFMQSMIAIPAPPAP